MKMQDIKFTDDTEMGEVAEGKHMEHKMSTMEDVAEQLKEDFEEEIEDCKKYLHMAGIAERAGHAMDCHYLAEMAKDEYTHAYFIHNFMYEHGIHVPEEQERDFEELTGRVKEFF